MSNSPGSNVSWRGEAALWRMRLLRRLVQHLPNPLIPDRVVREYLVDASICLEERVESKMEPELGELESPSAGTGVKAPEQQCLSNWEIEGTTVNGCLLVDGSSNFG